MQQLDDIRRAMKNPTAAEKKKTRRCPPDTPHIIVPCPHGSPHGVCKSTGFCNRLRPRSAARPATWNHQGDGSRIPQRPTPPKRNRCSPTTPTAMHPAALMEQIMEQALCSESCENAVKKKVTAWPDFLKPYRGKAVPILARMQAGKTYPSYATAGMF